MLGCCVPELCNKERVTACADNWLRIWPTAQVHGILIMYCQNCRYFHSMGSLAACIYPNYFSFGMPACLSHKTISCCLRLAVLN